jgi:hypothetical protein
MSLQSRYTMSETVLNYITGNEITVELLLKDERKIRTKVKDYIRNVVPYFDDNQFRQTFRMKPEKAFIQYGYKQSLIIKQCLWIYLLDGPGALMMDEPL